MKKKPSHAKHSPSSLGSKELCPSFVNRSGTNAAAEEGTLMHEALEKDNFSELNEEQIFLCGLCRDYRDGELKRFPQAKCFNELKLSIFSGLTYGTADFVAISENKAILMDWKFGRGSIEPAAINAQGAAYALGVLETFPDLESVEVHFVQPRTTTITTHTFLRSDVPLMQTRINTIVRRANARNREEHAGIHCQYCRKQATCTVLRNLALPIAAKYEELTILEELHASQISDPRLMAKCLDCAKILEEWCKSVKFHATEMALQGVEIPNYQIARKAGRRSISDPLAAYGVVQDKLNIEQFLGCCGTVSVDELTKTYSADAPRGSKQKTRDALITQLFDDGIITQGASSQFMKRQ